MDDMKDKFKGFMKKLNTQLSSSSSSGKFKGQGRVLGSGDGGSSSSSPPINPIHARYAQQPPLNSKPNQSPKPNPKPSSLNNSSPNSKPLPQKSSDTVNHSSLDHKPGEGFDPFDSLITTGKRSQNGYSLAVFECPICGQAFRSEDEVSVHVDSCVNNTNSASVACSSDTGDGDRSELEAGVSVYLSGKPKEGSAEVILRLLRNVVKEPDSSKFRRIRLGNPKIKEAVSDVAGGIELLEFVGFGVKEEDGEMWAVMEEIPDEERIGLINKVVVLVEGGKIPEKTENKRSASPAESEVQVEHKPIDRQIRVFFSVPENVAAKIELPDSFYNLTLDEVRREAEMRKKKIAESQLLIPKSYKEKQAKAARKRYTRTVIRVQFPDGVVLQGVFTPWEPTSALYEFVSTALKEPSLEFELLHPVPIKRRVIPHFPAAGEKAITIDEEDLVPSALVKFRPMETDSSVFTGLCNELLEIMEPLR